MAEEMELVVTEVERIPEVLYAVIYPAVASKSTSCNAPSWNRLFVR